MSKTARGEPLTARVGVLFLTLACCLAGTVPAMADRLDEIRARGHLIVGVKGDYHPFGVRDDTGKLVGYDIDVAHGLAEAVGVPAPVDSGNQREPAAENLRAARSTWWSRHWATTAAAAGSSP